MVNKVNKRNEDLTILSRYAKKVCMDFNRFESVQMKWANRNSNKVADLLCNLAIKKKCNLLFKMDYLLEIHNIVIHDAFN